MKLLHHEIKIYADGGSRRNGRPDALGGWGWVLLYREKKVRENCGSSRELVTNNQNEIYSACGGLAAIQPKWSRKDTASIQVYMDSAYVVSCINEGWHKKWRKNGWYKKANKKGGEVLNRELWEVLLYEISRLESTPGVTVTFHKVKGHDGDQWNEYADALVNAAMDMKIESLV